MADGCHEHVSLVPISFTVLVGGLALWYCATRKQLTKEAAARSEAQRLAVESQLSLLRTQLEPHMLFNTPANLRALVREDVERAESTINQLIVHLRRALAASRIELVAGPRSAGGSFSAFELERQLAAVQIQFAIGRERPKPEVRAVEFAAQQLPINGECGAS